MHRKRRLAGLLTALLISAVVTGCSSSIKTGAAATNESNTMIASYEQGDVDNTELYDRLLSESGMAVMLEMVDKGILDVVQPVTDEMNQNVEENLASIKQYYGEGFESALEQNGFKDEEAYKSALLLNLQRNAYIISYVERELLSEDEIKTYYDNYEPDIEASHILIKPLGDADADWTKAQETANELISRFESGEEFAALAMEYSDDTGSGMAGGALGAFGKGVMVPEFEEAAFALENGKHTVEPVRTQFGYHIILRTGGEEKGSLEEMKSDIVKSLAETILQADDSIGFKALIQMREENGFKIENDILGDQYKAMKDSFDNN